MLAEAVAEMLYKKDVLKNFAKFTGDHLRLSLFLNKVAEEKETPVYAFSCECCKKTNKKNKQKKNNKKTSIL